MMNLNPVPAAGTITIVRNGQTLDQRAVTIAPGQTRYDFPVHTESAGLVNYRATFKPANPALDTYPEDDSLQGWVGIGAQRKVLIVTGSQRDAKYLDPLVRRLGLDPTIVVADNGAWNGSPRGYDLVVLNNVSRAHVAPSAQSALVQYVAEGGSLAMVGGDQSFGLGGWQDSPVARVMPVSMKPPERHERKRALVLIIDKSGSMGRNDKLEYAKAAALTVTKTLSDSDMISVIGFDSQPFVVIPLESVGASRPYFSELIDRLKARGTTFLMPALEEAERTLAQSGAAIKHVVILTDGETGGTAAMYYDLVSSMHRDGGVTISTIAIGREANLDLLESIAKYGGGGFYQTDSPANLPELFLEDVRQRGGDTTMVEKDFVPYTRLARPGAQGSCWPPIAGAQRLRRHRLEAGRHLKRFRQQRRRARAGGRKLEVWRGQGARRHHRCERPLVRRMDRKRRLRTVMGQARRLDDSADYDRTEVRRRARLSRRTHRNPANRLQR